MFTNEDLAKHSAFKAVLKEGSFDMKGNAIYTVAMLFQWFEGLEDRIKEDIAGPKDKPMKIKEKKPPIKKIGS